VSEGVGGEDGEGSSESNSVFRNSSNLKWLFFSCGYMCKGYVYHLLLFDFDKIVTAGNVD
jgi:hypothetical protein